MKALVFLAACGAVAVAQEPKEALEARVAKALERARKPLLAELDRAHGGVRALLLLAALHDEVPADDKVFVRALKKLAEDRMPQTYDLALRLMIMAELSDYPNRAAAAARDTASLLRHVSSDGGFSYDEGGHRSDLSNTQYGALGLRAAVALGQKVPQQVWSRLVALLLGQQDAHGGFGYASTANGPSYASMTVAGIAVLEICKQHLEAETRKPTIESRIARGWKWMDAHVGDIGSIDTTWASYFHYGLERAAILSAKQEVGGKSWYELGAEMFVKEQLPDGRWYLGALFMGPRAAAEEGLGTPVDLAFAVLFLRRKFHKTLSGPLTPSRGAEIGALTSQSSDAEVQGAVALARARGLAAVPELIGCLRSRIVLQRKAAALALLAISGQSFDYEPYVDPDRQRDAIARIEAWWLAQSRSGPGKR